MKAKLNRKVAQRAVKKRVTTKRQSRALHDKRFPNESAAYRAARNKLLAAEMQLRDQTEAVAELRRKLPLGGEIAEDYAFVEVDTYGTPREVRFSQLFQSGQDTLVVYNFMYGPSMKQACTSCTSILDGLDGSAVHITNRVGLVVVAKSSIDRIAAFARQRGWRHLRLLSSHDNSFNDAYFGEADGYQMPMLNVFVRRYGKIYHTYGTELLYAPKRTGQDGRHVDAIWPLWNMFDFTPEGRGTTWYPRLSYSEGT
ncbi:MAG TPA: DUF899 family protein [Gemmatimonadaceae bacterium]|jgi:predicted dithiol-disulfide oxidoreductase (DUF899 family)